MDKLDERCVSAAGNASASGDAATVAKPSFFRRMISRSNARPIAAPHAPTCCKFAGFIAVAAVAEKERNRTRTDDERNDCHLAVGGTLQVGAKLRVESLLRHPRDDRLERVPGRRHQTCHGKIERNPHADDPLARGPTSKCVASLGDIPVNEKQSRIVKELARKIEVQRKQRIPVDRFFGLASYRIERERSTPAPSRTRTCDGSPLKERGPRDWRTRIAEARPCLRWIGRDPIRRIVDAGNGMPGRSNARSRWGRGPRAWRAFWRCDRG